MNLLQESNTFNTHKLAESFRTILPVDARYVSLSRIPATTANVIDEKGCEFRLPQTSDIYLINDIKVHLKVRLVTKDPPHLPPAVGAMVGPVNNVISSCISEVKLTVNNTKGKLIFCTYLWPSLTCFFFYSKCVWRQLSVQVLFA